MFVLNIHDTVEIHSSVYAFSENVTQSLLKVFSNLDYLKIGLVNEVGPSFMNGREEDETHISVNDDEEKKIPEGAVIQNLSDMKTHQRKPKLHLSLLQKFLAL